MDSRSAGAIDDLCRVPASKRRVYTGDGVDPKTVALPSLLYPWQAAIVRWALKKGRAAIFADCGLGKSFMQIAWARRPERADVDL